jgi:hypothetical protein
MSACVLLSKSLNRLLRINLFTYILNNEQYHHETVIEKNVSDSLPNLFLAFMLHKGGAYNRCLVRPSVICNSLQIIEGIL